MSRVFLLFFLFVISVTVASVVDVTMSSDAKVVNGVRVAKEATTARDYVYWSFANSNTFPVEVTYKVADYPSYTIVLNIGQKKRSYTSYPKELECEVIVKELKKRKR